MDTSSLGESAYGLGGVPFPLGAFEAADKADGTAAAVAVVAGAREARLGPHRAVNLAGSWCAGGDHRGGSVLIILLERVVVGECPVAGDSRCEHLGGRESWCYVLVDGASCIGQGLLVVVRRKAIRYALSSIKSVPSVTVTCTPISHHMSPFSIPPCPQTYQRRQK